MSTAHQTPPRVRARDASTLPAVERHDYTRVMTSLAASDTLPAMGVAIDVTERLREHRCLVCGTPSPGAALCRACQPSPPPGAFSAQIRSRPPTGGRAAAHIWIVDCFGRFHHFAGTTQDGTRLTIGRDESCALSVVDRSISREHAALVLLPGSPNWRLEDLRSRNTTRVGGMAVHEQVGLASGDRIGLATFEFRFFCIPESALSALGTPPHDGLSTVSQFQQRTLSFAPTEGSGGFISVEQQSPSGLDSHRVTLSELDFTVLYLLAGRFQSESNFEPAARGWVTTRELLDARIPFGTATPTSNNLRGAVKRIRDKFTQHGVQKIIESRQNIGYRISPLFTTIRL